MDSLGAALHFDQDAEIQVFTFHTELYVTISSPASNQRSKTKLHQEDQRSDDFFTRHPNKRVREYSPLVCTAVVVSVPLLGYGDPLAH